MFTANSSALRIYHHSKCLLILLSLLVTDCRYLPPLNENQFRQKSPADFRQRGIYSFSYDTGEGQHQSFRWESRSEDGITSGAYGFVDPDGLLRVTKYRADKFGYRAKNIVFHPVSLFPRNPSHIIGLLPQRMQSRPTISSFDSEKQKETLRENPKLRNEVSSLSKDNLQMSCSLGSCLEHSDEILEDIMEIAIPPRRLIIGPIPGHLQNELDCKKSRHKRKITNNRLNQRSKSFMYQN